MGAILCLETSGVNCSVALGDEKGTIFSKEINNGGYSHSEKLHLFIEQVLADSGLSREEIWAVSVSEGPGSYTGLRIGVSAAKGLCFAWGIPLISLPTLQVLVQNVQEANSLIIPMLDARRMEVYAAVFSPEKKIISPTQALILSPESFSDYLQENSVVFLGDGATKFKEICPSPNAVFLENQYPEASQMLPLAFEKYHQKAFEDLAYFQPFYLKSGVFPPKK